VTFTQRKPNHAKRDRSVDAISNAPTDSPDAGKKINQNNIPLSDRSRCSDRHGNWNRHVTEESVVAKVRVIVHIDAQLIVDLIDDNKLELLRAMTTAARALRFTSFQTGARVFCFVDVLHSLPRLTMISSQNGLRWPSISPFKPLACITITFKRRLLTTPIAGFDIIPFAIACARGGGRVFSCCCVSQTPSGCMCVVTREVTRAHANVSAPAIRASAAFTCSIVHALTGGRY
jgi:hypothetical protein